MKNTYTETIEKVSGVIGKTFPLYSFITSNPLSGYEYLPFIEAVKNAGSLLNSKVFPEASVYRQAWKRNEIDEKELKQLLLNNGLNESPEYYLEQLEKLKNKQSDNPNHTLDRIMVKWLSVFMDEGLAEWEMPDKNEGFYKSWRKLAVYDSELNKDFRKHLPANSQDALAKALDSYTHEEQLRILQYHLVALPGWTGYIKNRIANNTLWQQQYNITLEDYLAVRLTIAGDLKAVTLPEINVLQKKAEVADLQYIWLKAWEKSWQNKMVKRLNQQTVVADALENEEEIPDAQMVFCIDTRSELIRRSVETQGNYETFGYAGFFGIAMDYTSPDDGLRRKSCPPIVPSAYNVTEVPQENKSEKFIAYKKNNERKKFTHYFLRRLKNMLPSAFGYVEGSGIFYGLSLLSRTLLPGQLYKPEKNNASGFENDCQPKMCNAHKEETPDSNISIEEKTAIVKSAFDLTGWRTFAPLVLFTGHGSHSANNPFGSSLDCGACAASPGRHNARLLAQMANLPEVRKALKNIHHIIIPDDTIFIGAEHNTTTDEIVLYDTHVPASHKDRLNRIKADLKKAQQMAANERLGGNEKSIITAHTKTNNWSETRPEWGLAKNAGFIIGSRTLTKNMNLEGNCFLHSYNWKLDTEGKALEAIMQGPMVVTQWINNHYYFSTVDNEQFGGGSKITHNITGKFGIVQGNGGDLKTGLPLQSVNESDDIMYHRPLRLSVIIQAPLERLQDILERNSNLKALLDNEWIYLMAIDPTKNNTIMKYKKGFNHCHRGFGLGHFHIPHDGNHSIDTFLD